MLCGVKSSIAVTQCASRSGAEVEIKIVLYGSTSRLCHAAAVTDKTPQRTDTNGHTIDGAKNDAGACL